MSRKELVSPLVQIGAVLLAGCEFASPDQPEASVVLKQGVDPMLVIVLLVVAFAGGWYAHNKLRGGEVKDISTDGYDSADEEPPN